MGAFESAHKNMGAFESAHKFLGCVVDEQQYESSTKSTSSKEQQYGCSILLLSKSLFTMRKGKLRPGVGCKATILTKFIHPKQNNIDASHRSTVVLLSNEKKTVGRKSQECYTFRFVDGNNSDIFYAVKTHFKIIEEGRNEDFFDSVSVGEIRVEAQSKKFKEPKMKWRKSKAKRILYNARLEGIIPVDDKNFQQMSLEDVYSIDPELALYDYSKLKNRLNRLRNKILELDRRADDDLIAFNNYKKNHKPSLFSHKGFIQWQGSSAQEHLWDDLEDYVKDPSMKPMELWKSRPEYMNEFPLDAFRDKIKQEIRTAKYLHTLKERGKQHRAS
ncbi:hypothetical protein IV203_032395 [Nitzschia inconspicua]|uniref:Uncharacterized protein n=1 Tax=Nitzschia inconspicua TaxID=303405 RepID=A0A9K3PH87_9STRA|nr:hypothetical protein IV203_032395 [Nitzschia inconspicua]